MIRVYQIQDLMMPGQFEGFGHRRIFMQQQDDVVRGLLTDAAAFTSPGSRFVFSPAIPGERRMLSMLTALVREPWMSAVRSEDLPD